MKAVAPHDHFIDRLLAAGFVLTALGGLTNHKTLGEAGAGLLFFGVVVGVINSVKTGSEEITQ
jgi:hypothetical protein